MEVIMVLVAPIASDVDTGAQLSQPRARDRHINYEREERFP